jgi:hypothetical protein
MMAPLKAKYIQGIYFHKDTAFVLKKVLTENKLANYRVAGITQKTTTQIQHPKICSELVRRRVWTNSVVFQLFNPATLRLF